MSFIELHIDLSPPPTAAQRNPEPVTKPVTVSTRYIVQIEPRETTDKDGGATVTLSGGSALRVVESYKSLKRKLHA